MVHNLQKSKKILESKIYRKKCYKFINDTPHPPPPQKKKKKKTTQLDMLKTVKDGAYYAEKAELNTCSWYPKRKLGVMMHVLKINKLQFRKKSHTLL